MFGIGMPELIVIFLIILIVFGARRLPEIGSGMGKAIKNFKSGVTEAKNEPPAEPKKVQEADTASEGVNDAPKAS